MVCIFGGEKMKPRAVFIGRFSPFHNGHLAIMQEKIKAGVPLLVLVRDTDYDDWNVDERGKMIKKTFEKLKVDVIVYKIPDIESVNYGRGVGYEINEIEVPEDVKGISATDIRKKMKEKDKSWKDFVPEGSAEVIEEASKLDTTEPFVIWLTGLPCSGKSTIAKGVYDADCGNVLIDGDKIRKTINSDLGFSHEDRKENLRRVAYIAKHSLDNIKLSDGNVICSFVSPYKEVRDMVREIIGPQFMLVHVDCSVKVCERRDVKGMYALARQGEIKNFTGISDPYEKPDDADVILNTELDSVEQCVDKIRKWIVRHE